MLSEPVPNGPEPARSPPGAGPAGSGLAVAQPHSAPVIAKGGELLRVLRGGRAPLHRGRRAVQRRRRRSAMSAPPAAIRAAAVIAAYQVELDDPVLARAPPVVTGVFAAAAEVVAEADGVPDGVAEAVGEGEADPEGLAVGSPLGAVPRSGASVILDSASR
ncbi:hypothetical protein ACFO9E_29985 [Streptomyces maoxianensis]|uniref:Uncharacterized protein n=1 Tax=Streptomyces maoxianensis TaxID=1459942 RepID=A0ABV9GFX7_9ACTN